MDIAALKEIIKNKDLEIDRKTNENASAHTELIKKDSKIQKLENELNRLKAANKNLVVDNITIVKSNKRIFEMKIQYKEKIDIACKYTFVDKFNGIEMTKLDASKLTKKDVIECYTLLGLM